MLEAIDRATNKISLNSKAKPTKIGLPAVEGDSEKIIQLPYDKYPQINFIELLKGDSGSNIIDVQSKTKTTIFFRGKANSVSSIVLASPFCVTVNYQLVLNVYKYQLLAYIYIDANNHNMKI